MPNNPGHARQNPSSPTYHVKPDLRVKPDIPVKPDKPCEASP